MRAVVEQLRAGRKRVGGALTLMATSDAGLYGLVVTVLLGGLVLLSSRQHNFDEGLYIQQALLILNGRLPYRDFFYHQTPLYPLLLAAFGWINPSSLVVFRGLSLLATAATGVFVYRIADRLVARRAAFCAALLFYVAPLQFYGLLAVPLALMQLCQVAGTYLVFFHRARPAIVGGAVLLVISVLFKPLTVAGLIAVGGCLLLVPQQRSKVPWVVAAGAMTGCLAWGAFHLMSDGAFTRVLLLQFGRYAHRGGFDAMMQFEPFWKFAAAAGATNAVAWNLDEHRLTFFVMPLLNGNFWLLCLAAAGQVIVWREAGVRWAGRRMFLTLWWVIPVLFSVYVWEPIWDHYCLQYVPPMAVLAAIYLNRAWSRPSSDRRSRRLAGVGLTLAVLLGAVGVVGRQEAEFSNLDTAHAGETWLTFDPLYNFVTQTKPACGLIDPFNVYGPNSLVAMATAPELSRFLITADDIMRCLQGDPSIKVLIGAWSPWFLDARLLAYLRTLPTERIVGRLPEA
jgi:4-amino-4-deoxy-L-arabinose transferase-like glycosyltransferase